MTPFPLRLSWKLGRTELVLIGALCWGLAVAAALLSFYLETLAASCVDAGVEAVCEQSREFSSTSELGRQLMIGFATLPIVAGVVLGTQLVARDLEEGTAQLSWPLARTRRRLFIPRALSILLFLLAFVLPLALAGHLLEGSIERDFDPMASLTSLGLRGPGLVMRSIVCFAIGTVTGAVVGRTLPALLVAAVPAVALVALWAPLAVLGHPVEIISPLGQPSVASAVVFDVRYVAPDGRLLTREEASASVPDGVDLEDWLVTEYTAVAVGVSGARYPAIELRSGLMAGALAGVLLLASLAVVERRRPY